MATKDRFMQKSIPFTSKVLKDEWVMVWSWPQLAYFFGAVLACFLLILSIQYGSGYYNPISIRLLLSSVALSILIILPLFWTQFTASNQKLLSNFSIEAVILFTNLLLIFVLMLGLQDAYLHYNQNPLFPTFAKGVGWLIVLIVTTYLITLPVWAEINRFKLIMGLMLILKIVVVFSSYIHINDVDIMMQESLAHLLAGRNPYATATAGFAGYIYLPLNLLLPLPFYVGFGDTRFGSIFGELLGVAFIYKLAATALSSTPKLVKLVELVILLFVLQPRGLFFIEQACAEPLVVGIIGIYLYFFTYKPANLLTDILLAALLAIKQYLIFMCLPLFILHNFNWKRYTNTVLALALFILPFVWWNPVAFYDRTVLHFFQLPIQTTSLGLAAYFSEQDVSIPRWISPVAVAIVTPGLGLLLKRFGLLGYLHTIILTFFCLFLFGQQAFANYYYLISFLQMTAIIFFLIYSSPRRNQPLLKVT